MTLHSSGRKEKFVEKYIFTYKNIRECAQKYNR